MWQERRDLHGENCILIMVCENIIPSHSPRLPEGLAI